MLFILVQIQAGPPAFAGFASFGSASQPVPQPKLEPKSLGGLAAPKLEERRRGVGKRP
jgi:hypothetical protein